MPKKTRAERRGIWSALASAFFLGLAPIFGKQAINFGFSPLVVVALRTGFAALLLLFLVALFNRRYLYIYPAGMIGCALAGAINGIGSILYYLALERLSVSLGQLLYSLYPVFLLIWFLLDGQKSGWLTYLRLVISLCGVVLLTATGSGYIDWIGVILMLGASALYAFHLPINQRVLFDIPAPTVTLYTLIAMSIVTLPALFFLDFNAPIFHGNWQPILYLALVTFFSRLTLFHGIKRLGGTQTSLLGLSELFVSIFISHLLFKEILQPVQWIGAAMLVISLSLIGFEKISPEKRHIRGGLLSWLSPPDINSKFPWGMDH